MGEVLERVFINAADSPLDEWRVRKRFARVMNVRRLPSVTGKPLPFLLSETVQAPLGTNLPARARRRGDVS